MRVVVDPGVFVSGLISAHGPPDELMRLWAEGAFEIVVSPGLMTELRDVLERPHIARVVAGARAKSLVRALEQGAVDAADPDDPPPVTRDRKDDYLVALARAAGAYFIVSGDGDLLEADVRPPVVTPRELLQLLQPS